MQISVVTMSSESANRLNEYVAWVFGDVKWTVMMWLRAMGNMKQVVVCASCCSKRVCLHQQSVSHQSAGAAEWSSSDCNRLFSTGVITDQTGPPDVM